MRKKKLYQKIAWSIALSMAVTTITPATNVIAADKGTSIKIITNKKEKAPTPTPIKLIPSGKKEESTKKPSIIIPNEKKEPTKTPTVVVPGGKKEETTKEPEVTKKPSTGVTNEKKEETVKQQEVLKEGQDSQFKYQLLEDGSGYQIVKWIDGSNNNAVIPEEFNGLPVKSIGDSAFVCCDSLSSVEIGEGVKSIGRAAFSSCSSLRSVEIPSSVESIGAYAFSDCSSLSSVEIGICMNFSKIIFPRKLVFGMNSKKCVY